MSLQFSGGCRRVRRREVYTLGISYLENSQKILEL